MIASPFTTILLSILIGGAACAAFLWCTSDGSRIAGLFRRYRSWWSSKIKESHLDPGLESVPYWQTGGGLFFLLVAAIVENPLCLILVLSIIALPPIVFVHFERKRKDALQAGLDGFLVALADALTTVPNLAEALSTLLDNLESPIKEEIQAVLSQVRLGRSIDDALQSMAHRLALPGFDAAVGAALLGKRMGGDLPAILRKIAATLREMERLEGVIRTKTAEGRSQAWVMGAVPPGLVLVLEKIDPNWLSPLWNDPFGWTMLGCAAVLEVSAVALIRKIMAVDI